MTAPDTLPGQQEAAAEARSLARALQQLHQEPAQPDPPGPLFEEVQQDAT